MNRNIAPFALPGGPRSEIRFEEPRDVTRIEIRFQKAPPADLELWYSRQKWPGVRLEATDLDTENPCVFGWSHSDDWFNLHWQKAAIQTEALLGGGIAITFQPLSAEMPERSDYAVEYRRALAFRVQGVAEEDIQDLAVFTRSEALSTGLRVELDRGSITPAQRVKISTYNAASDKTEIDCSSSRSFELAIEHMLPAHRYSGDDGHVTIELDADAFTLSLTSLRQQGPIWFEDLGIYIRESDDPTSFAEYRSRIGGEQTLAKRVLATKEQSLTRAMNGQPRAHPVSQILACAMHPQRFRLEPNGDLVMEKWPVTDPPARPSPRFRNRGTARMFFGLERWIATAQFNDPAPSPAHNICARLDQITVEQKSLAVPLDRPIDAELTHDDTIVALVRFTFTNCSALAATAQLSLGYSSDSSRARNPRDFLFSSENEHLVPVSPLENLSASGDTVFGNFDERQTMRCLVQTSMQASGQADGILFQQKLPPGASCTLLLKVPYVALESAGELESLRQLDFDSSLAAANHFWRAHCARGATLSLPEPRLNDCLHASHLMHVAQTDLLMPDGSGLVNTSVGTSTYGNFSNESCMIIHDLHERGLFEEARRRLELWIKYQGSAPQPGNFTDFNGMYYGAAGFERGAYNQHHGWVLWCLAEHYLFTRDAAWLNKVAASIIAGCDWVFRQRRNTLQPLPHSRGWERGFLPAGSLEDVTDFYYWLSTNCLTWRGVHWAASALEKGGHPDASRIRREADDYQRDLIRGFDINRRHAPLVRLRDGRWVPHFPSRLYCRGRDTGWIRETLEGSIYLLISGLYPPHGKQAQWILDDYQDNRYPSPPFGYSIPDFAGDWFCRAGFSIQPNLLAGLMPYLDRDEPEVAIWMFFNAFAACYRDQIGAMVEHPFPQLGFSNAAHFKTSDQSNALSWLRHLVVHVVDDTLHVGRAVPRAWLADGQRVSSTGVHTPFGAVSVSYTSELSANQISAVVEFAFHESPRRCVLRFRHPSKAPLRAVEIDGKPHSHFEPLSGDVDLTGMKGRLAIRACY